jgi:hypothetical protein
MSRTLLADFTSNGFRSRFSEVSLSHTRFEKEKLQVWLREEMVHVPME